MEEKLAIINRMRGGVMMPLDERDKEFANLYVKNRFNGKAAYYELNQRCNSDNSARASASRLLNKDGMRNYISEIARNVRDNSDMVASQEEVLLFFSSVMRGDIKRRREVIAGGAGLIEVEETPTVAESLRAAEALARAYGLNELRQRIEVGNSVKEVATMTMAEKIKLLKAAVKEISDINDSG